MSAAAVPSDADVAMLDELAGLLMDAARMAHGRMAAAETDADFAASNLALQRAARGVRQTVALKSRLADGQFRARRKAARAGEKALQAQEKLRAQQLNHFGERLIEADDPDIEVSVALTLELSNLIDRERLTGRLLNQPLAPQLARLADELGLTVTDADLADLAAAEAYAAGDQLRPPAVAPPPATCPAPQAYADTG
jgi:hypothetical protein